MASINEHIQNFSIEVTWELLSTIKFRLNGANKETGNETITTGI